MERIDNIYHLCSGYYDKNTQKFVYYDRNNIFKCCNNQCEIPFENCKKYCEKEYTGDQLTKCNKECYNFNNTCKSICLINETNLPFKDCYEKICPDSSINCLDEKQNELLECCKKNCNCENCDKLCGYLYDYTKDDLIKNNTLFDLQSSENTKQDSIKITTLNSIFILIIGGILIFLIWNFFKKF